MTSRFEVEFRGLRYAYGLTGNTAHERCLATGFEKVYKRRGPGVYERKVLGREYLADVVSDRELIAVLDGLFAQTGVRG